ncbi:MAG: hypothetical protein BHW45_05370 [Roseburia sp. CAG:197_41_10]|nr:MAG: hypothetical protein BHW45_05370 [Roseburia sp. CAG:197_41_10]
MTNQEKYKQAFSVLQTSGDFSMEVEKMAMRQKHHKVKTIAAAVAACIVLVGGAGTAYAANLGGIQRTIQLWINGDQTNATLEINNDGNSSTYTIKIPDENGNSTEITGGGVAMDGDGVERPLTEDEIMEQINQPDVEYEDDGSVWLYYKDRKLDITDRFEDGICYVKLTDGKDVKYLTIKYNDGYAMSDSKYVSM